MFVTSSKPDAHPHLPFLISAAGLRQYPLAETGPITIELYSGRIVMFKFADNVSEFIVIKEGVFACSALTEEHDPDRYWMCEGNRANGKPESILDHTNSAKSPVDFSLEIKIVNQDSVTLGLSTQPPLFLDRITDPKLTKELTRLHQCFELCLKYHPKEGGKILRGKFPVASAFDYVHAHRSSQQTRLAAPQTENEMDLPNTNAWIHFKALTKTSYSNDDPDRLIMIQYDFKDGFCEFHIYNRVSEYKKVPERGMMSPYTVLVGYGESRIYPGDLVCSSLADPQVHLLNSDIFLVFSHKSGLNPICLSQRPRTSLSGSLYFSSQLCYHLIMSKIPLLPDLLDMQSLSIFQKTEESPICMETCLSRFVLDQENHEIHVSSTTLTIMRGYMKTVADLASAPTFAECGSECQHDSSALQTEDHVAYLMGKDAASRGPDCMKCLWSASGESSFKIFPCECFICGDCLRDVMIWPTCCVCGKKASRVSIVDGGLHETPKDYPKIRQLLLTVFPEFKKIASDLDHISNLYSDLTE